MKRIALKQEQVPEFLNGATELRVPVRPQPWCNKFGTWIWQPDTAWHRRFPQYGPVASSAEDLASIMCTYKSPTCPYPVGSEVALTETWRAWFATHADGQPIGEDWRVRYRADMAARLTGVGYDEGPLQVSPEECGLNVEPRYWRSPATMPAEFSRFKRRVVAVIVEYGELWVWVLELEVK